MSFESRDLGAVDGSGFDSRSFLQRSGAVATGIAVTVLPMAAVGLVVPGEASADRLGPAVEPAGDVPSETVMAYVHDAARGDVTIVAGTSQMTYRDPALAKRLLDAADTQTDKRN